MLSVLNKDQEYYLSIWGSNLVSISDLETALLITSVHSWKGSAWSSTAARLPCGWSWHFDVAVVSALHRCVSFFLRRFVSGRVFSHLPSLRQRLARPLSRWSGPCAEDSSSLRCSPLSDRGRLQTCSYHKMLAWPLSGPRRLDPRASQPASTPSLAGWPSPWMRWRLASAPAAPHNCILGTALASSPLSSLLSILVELIVLAIAVVATAAIAAVATGCSGRLGSEGVGTRSWRALTR